MGFGAFTLWRAGYPLAWRAAAIQKGSHRGVYEALYLGVIRRWTQAEHHAEMQVTAKHANEKLRSQRGIDHLERAESRKFVEHLS